MLDVANTYTRVNVILPFMYAYVHTVNAYFSLNISNVIAQALKCALIVFIHTKQQFCKYWYSDGFSGKLQTQ